MGHRVLAFTTLLLVSAVGTLAGTALAQPSNDGCSAATVISALPYVDTRDTTAATTDLNDPTHSNTCGSGTQDSNSVWYRFTPSTSGLVSATTFASSYDT